MSVADRPQALVIGAGPAGLMAAEVLAGQGARVTLAEAMPTPARKFLMAGKSGLNLTKDEEAQAFRARFHTDGAPTPIDLGLADFGPEEVMAWARGLGIELFCGSTGRVFPRGMKASPLLRAWLARLDGQGVVLHRRWRWVGCSDGAWQFQTPQGLQSLRPQTVVLALGGASWPGLGADAGWTAALAAQGVALAPFRPANMGFHVDWSPVMARFAGQAVKGVALTAAGQVSRGEWVITRAGVEGGGIYELSAAIRDGAPVLLDLAPDLEAAELARRLARVPAKLSIGNRLRRVLGCDLRAALLMEWGRPLPADPARLALRAKALHPRLGAPMGLARAISAAGGIRAAALGADLGLRALPGVFAAGEMLDWEAPTGGYLLTGCLASGRRAGQAAADYLAAARR